MMQRLLQKAIILILFSVILLLYSEAFTPSTQNTLACRKFPAIYGNLPLIPLNSEPNEDNQLEGKPHGVEYDTEKDSFDGNGFSNYLGPYVVALIASVVVTGGFVKFVLMNY
eukprot:scaffold7139_cov115-Cylindrotheca_fusiformis.AAC.9